MKRLIVIALALCAIPLGAEARGRTWVLTTNSGTSLDYIGRDDSTPLIELICTDGRQVEVSVGFQHHFAGARRRGDAWVDARGRPAPWPGQLIIASDATSAVFPATVEPDNAETGSYVIATIPASSPVMTAFAATGHIRLTSSGESLLPPSVPVAKAARLVANCRR